MQTTSTTSTASTANGFTGWLRLPGQPWRAVVDDAAEDEALARLMAEADRTPGRAKDLTVLPAGEDPNRRPVRRVRVRGNDLSFFDARDA